MEPSDFPIGMEPAQGFGGLVANPWLWITALLLAGLIFFMGLQWGKLKAEEKAREALKKNLEAIYKAINDKARAAAAAPKPQVMSGAQALLNEINRLLGPVAALGSFGSLTGNLSNALEGKGGHDDHAHDDHGHGDHGGADHGGAHAATDKAKAASAAAAASNIHITIGDVSQGASAHAGGHGSAHGIDISAIRKAVLEFTDYWSRPTMVAELMAAQRALVTPMPHAPPKPVSKPASSH